MPTPVPAPVKPSDFAPQGSGETLCALFTRWLKSDNWQEFVAFVIGEDGLVTNQFKSHLWDITVPVGGVIYWPVGYDATKLPKWKVANGELLGSNTYPDLFLAIGTFFNNPTEPTVPDGSAFRLPNLSGSFLAGEGTFTKDSVSQPQLVVGARGGAQAHKLTAEETGVAAHTHKMESLGRAGNDFANQNTAGYSVMDIVGTAGPVLGATNPNTAAEAAQAHPNMPPYTVGTWIIRVLV